MGRKIKHYSSGYQIRRKKQKRIMTSCLFGVFLILLVFVGYVGAKTINGIQSKSETGDVMASSENFDISSSTEIESESTYIDIESEPSSDSTIDDSEIIDSEVTSEMIEEAEIEPSESSEVETLYSEYGDVQTVFTPVKENPFTAYGEAVSAYIPERETPKTADNEDLKAITMPLTTALSTSLAQDFIDSVDTSIYNAVVVPLKDSDGIVYYSTNASTAKASGAISSSRIDIDKIVAMIREKGLKPVASIYSLHDHTSAHTSYGTSYFWMNDGSTTWLDAKVVNGGQPWMNPYCSATITYLDTLAEEIDNAGFVDLIVYGNQYPDSTLQQKMGLGETYGVSTVDQLQKVLESMQNSAPTLRVIPAYQGDCYTSGVNTQVYTDTPNAFTFTPSAPIISDDLSILDKVTADSSTLIPVISGTDLIPSLSERGINSYIVQ